MTVSNWIATFEDVLTHPRSAFAFLSDADAHRPDAVAVFSAGCTVLLSLFFVAISRSGFDNLLSVFLFIWAMGLGLACWLGVSVVAWCASKLVAHPAGGFAQSLILTGWAFAPLVLLGPIDCVRIAVPALATICALAVIAWLVVLQWLAIKSLLRINHSQMLLFALVMPALFAFIYMSWFTLTFVVTV